MKAFMTLHHYAALKTATWIFGLGAALLYVMDPTEKVALIAMIPGAITGIGLIFFRISDKKESRRERALDREEATRQFNVLHTIGTDTAAKVDGILSGKDEKLVTRTTELSESRQRTARLEGAKEGSDSERNKDNT
jgi:hypothetical protein